MKKTLRSASLLAIASLICLKANANGKIDGGRPAGSTAITGGPTLSYTNPRTYTVGTAIAPLVPTASGVYTASYNSTPVNIGSGFSVPEGVAVDAGGNIYIADYNAAVVKKISADRSTITTVGSGFTSPYGVAVSAAGDVYVADYGAAKVFKVPGGTGTPVAIGSGYTHPINVAVDAAGNVYVNDFGTGYVTEILASNGSTQYLSFGYFSQPFGLALDIQNNVYVSDFSNGNVAKIPAGGGTPVVVGSGFGNPGGVAVDGAGNIYVDDQGGATIKKIPAGGGTTVAINQTIYGLQGLAIDPLGNLYETNNQVLQEISPSGGYFISPALPAGLSFNSNTGIISGTPTVATPATTYTITAYNPNGGTSFLLTIKTVLPPPPVISYATPKTYIAGTAIAPLSPTASGVSAPGYNGTLALIGSGFSSAALSLAMDAAGNIYVADGFRTTLTKIPAGGGAPTPFGSGFSAPYGIAIDKAGNFYVADYGNNTVKKIPAGGGAAVSIGSGLGTPINVAVDAAGNVYVADFSGSVKEILASNGTTVTIGSGFSEPVSIALDAAANIYVSDYGNGQVTKMPPGGGTPVVLASGFSAVNCLTIDNAGNIYVADQGNNLIKEIPAGGGAVISLFQTSLPKGIIIDQAGTIAFTTEDGNAFKITPTGGYYISPVLPAGLSFNSATGVISGTPTAVSPATTYQIAAYNLGGGASASVNIQVRAAAPATLSYATPKVYTSGTAIAALTPTSSGVAAAAYSATPVTATTGLHTPWGVAVDAAGNVFFGDRASNSVKELPVGTNTSFTIASGFSSPYGVAVDAQGNVYVADYGNNAIKKIAPGGSPVTIIGTGFSHPTGVAVDQKGNVFVADYGNNLAKKIAFDNSSTLTIGAGFTNPIGIAVDSTGNVYVADFGNNAIKKIPAGGGTPVVIGSGFNGPTAVTVDASGNVFVADYANNAIKEMRASGGGILTIGSGFGNPPGVAVAPSGVVYVSDVSNVIKQINPSGGYYISQTLPAGLSFSNTTGTISGTPTSVSPATNYTVTAYNIGGGTSANLSIAVTASTNALLTKIALSGGVALTSVSGPGYKNYTATVPNTTSTIEVTATAQDPTATIKINGVTTASGTPSADIPLAVGNTTINTIVTAQDGVTTKNYIITVTRSGSSVATLSKIATNTGVALTQVSGADYRDYTISVPNATSSMTVTPTTTDPGATVKVNGVTVASGTASGAIPLAVGTTTVNTVVTAADGVTTDTYGITITRAAALSNNALLSKIATNTGVALTQVAGADYRDYTISVPNSTASMTVTPTTQDATATVKVNGVTVASGTASAAIPLAVGTTSVSTVVTAQDGVTTNTYKITVTRAAMMALYHPKDSLSTDGLVIHEGVTPNGDGINDVFVIDGLTAYPDNKVTIMSRSGAVIYEATGYDNQSKFFDGHSNKNGTMQKPGTYFYSLQYTANGKARYTTGFIVLKY